MDKMEILEADIATAVREIPSRKYGGHTLSELARIHADSTQGDGRIIREMREDMTRMHGLLVRFWAAKWSDHAAAAMAFDAELQDVDMKLSKLRPSQE